MTVFFRVALFATLALVSNSLSAAVVLTTGAQVFTSGDHVTQITGISVDGTLYDANFHNPIETFAGLTGPDPKITFTDASTATAVVQGIESLLNSQNVVPISAGGTTAYSQNYYSIPYLYSNNIVSLAYALNIGGTPGFPSLSTHWFEDGGAMETDNVNDQTYGLTGQTPTYNYPAFVTFSQESSTAPEPTSIITWLSLMGVAGVGWLRRRAAILPSTAQGR
jgi:hypothetical protein